MIVACYHPLPLSACMLNFDLVSILFGTTSFNILVKMFLHLYIVCLHTIHIHNTNTGQNIIDHAKIQEEYRMLTRYRLYKNVNPTICMAIVILIVSHSMVVRCVVYSYIATLQVHRDYTTQTCMYIWIILHNNTLLNTV